MINELYAMAQVLKEKDLLQITTHRDIGEPAKSAGLYIEIDENRQPKSINFLAKEQFVKVWKHSKGNHNSFPVIRIHKPIVDHKLSTDFDSKIWGKLKGKEQKVEILSQLEFNKLNPESKDIIISDWTVEQLLPVCQGVSELDSLHELINRFPKNHEEQKQFYIYLLKNIRGQLNTFEEPLLDLIKDILIGSYSKNGFCSNTQIAFDVYDAHKFTFKVKDIRLKNILIQELNKKDTQNNVTLETDFCQLTGELQVIEKDKFPNPKLPILGNTYLYSKKEDIECLTRYGMKSLQAYKVGKEKINEMNYALNFITNPEREGKTWVQVPGSTDKELNLFIAYVEDEPEMDNELAKMMGDAPDFEEEAIRFEILAEQVCGSLRKKTELNPNARIKALVINKVDDGRKQILFSDTYGVNDIISGTTKWQIASKNHPNIEYRIKVNQEEKTIAPYCPYPGQILDFMKKFWKFETKNNMLEVKVEKVPGISLKEIYEIFIPLSDEKESSKRLLSKIYQHSKNLLINIGHNNNRRELYYIKKSSINAIYDNCLAVSLISILLYKLNYCKEDYMYSVAFNIGRLMMLADVLHREYCLNVNPQKGGAKSGKIPPQLIGNSIMPTAVEFPNRALDLLGERLRIYKAWADSVSANDETKIAKWAVNQMGITSLEISKQEIPESFNEAERVQVLLGYLAKIEKE